MLLVNCKIQNSEAASGDNSENPEEACYIPKPLTEKDPASEAMDQVPPLRNEKRATQRKSLGMNFRLLRPTFRKKEDINNKTNSSCSEHLETSARSVTSNVSNSSRRGSVTNDKRRRRRRKVRVDPCPLIQEIPRMTASTDMIDLWWTREELQIRRATDQRVSEGQSFLTSEQEQSVSAVSYMQSTRKLYHHERNGIELNKEDLPVLWDSLITGVELGHRGMEVWSTGGRERRAAVRQTIRTIVGIAKEQSGERKSRRMSISNQQREAQIALHESLGERARELTKPSAVWAQKVGQADALAATSPF